MITRVELPEGRYSLVRTRDGAGDSGPAIAAFDWNTNKAVEVGALVLGCAVRCGSIMGRSYAAQDWWNTTPITEFMEVSDDRRYVKFRTENSVYEVRVL